MFVQAQIETASCLCDWRNHFPCIFNKFHWLIKSLIWRCFWFENISVFPNREVISIYWSAKTQHASHQNSENVCCIPLLHVILENISTFLTFSLHEKCPNTELFLVRIFPHLDWIRRDTEYLSVFSLNAGKYGLEKTPYLDTFYRSVWFALFPERFYILWTGNGIEIIKFWLFIQWNEQISLFFIRSNISRLCWFIGLIFQPWPFNDCFPKFFIWMRFTISF